MDEGEIKIKTKIGNLHEELIIKDEPINQFSVLPSTENSNIPSKKVQIKAKVEKSDLQRNRQKWACSVPQCSDKLTNRIFGYPSNATQKELWLQAFKLDHCKTSDKVCDLHFKASDFGSQNARRPVPFVLGNPRGCEKSDNAMHWSPQLSWILVFSFANQAGRKSK